MKKISISALALAAAFAITASATVTTPPVNSTTTTSTTTTTTIRATTTTPRVEDNRNQVYSSGQARNNYSNTNDRDRLGNGAIKRADGACAMVALTKRDVVVTAALQKYASAWIDSINVRRAAQAIAFTKEGKERLTLVRASRKVAHKTQDMIQKELKVTKRAAGEVYRAEMRLCGYDIDSSDE